MLAIVYLVLFLCAGNALMCWHFPRKSPIVRWVVGAGVGLALLMVLPALCAFALRFTRAAHVAALFVLLLVLGVSYVTRDKKGALRRWGAEEKAAILPMLVFVIPLTALSFYLQYTHVLMPAADGSLWCGQSTYGDLNLHLGIITSLRDAQFPPNYSILAGEQLRYPFLADSLSTSMMLLGLPLRWAVIVPGTLMMAMVYAGYFVLARRVIGPRYGVILLAGLFFFFNGGLGFFHNIDMALRDSTKFEEIFTGFYKTPANQPSLNLRWSNVIADLMVPQRALLGGWTILIPTLYMLLDAVKEKGLRDFAWVGLLAVTLPLLHTHSFLALGLFSGGILLYTLWREKGVRGKTLRGMAVYLLIVLAFALPQLIDFAFKQTVEGGVIRIQFNWVNNSGNKGMIDEYFYFWIKNVGLPFILFLCALLDGEKRGRAGICFGAMAIFVVAEIVLFQRNEYDNNKLFYVFYMFAAMLAADYAHVLWVRMAGLRARVLLAGLVIFCSVFSGALSIARECVSGYQLFNVDAVQAAAYVEDNTPEGSMFMTSQTHINPVAALAGRNIVCGSDLYLYFHGLSYGDKVNDCVQFYADPEKHLDVLTKYGVDYIYAGDYEHGELVVNDEALEALFDIVYRQGRVTIYAVGDGDD